MRLTLSTVLFACASFTAGAQATARPTSEVAGTVVRRPGADLVIDSLDVRLGSGVAGGITLEGDGVRVTGLFLIARVTNRGTVRWAAPRGAVGFSLKSGREEATPDHRRTAGSVSAVPRPTVTLGRGVMAPFGPFQARAAIPGSLAPGESRVVAVLLSNRSGNTTLIFQRDKYYTLEATLRTQGDVNETNNRSRHVGRFDTARDQLIARWEPFEVLDVRTDGAVQVNAPPRP